MKIRIAANAQGDGVSRLRMPAQPAAAQTGGTVCMMHQAHQQVQRAIAGEGGDGVFAVRQGRAGIGERLRISAPELMVSDGPLAPDKCLRQRLRVALPLHGNIARQARALQDLVDLGHGAARPDLGDVARGPVGQRTGSGCQGKVEHGPTDAAGIQLDTIAQPPGFVPRRGPVLRVGPVAQLADMVLPVAQGTVVGVVDFHQVEQRLRALSPQPVIELVAEGAELRVFAIAQGQDGVAQRVQRECLRHHVADEAERGVGRIAFAGGADDEHGARDSLQPRRIQPFQPRALDRNAAVAQRRGCHVGQLHRETGLTGMHHPRRIRSGQHHRLS